MDNMETMPMDLDVAFASMGISQPEVPEVTTAVVDPKTLPVEDVKGSSRPAILDTVEPIAPADQRKLVPKSKAKAKAKAKSKSKAEVEDSEKPKRGRKRKTESGDGKVKTKKHKAKETEKGGVTEGETEKHGVKEIENDKVKSCTLEKTPPAEPANASGAASSSSVLAVEPAAPPRKRHRTKSASDIQLEPAVHPEPPVHPAPAPATAATDEVADDHGSAIAEPPTPDTTIDEKKKKISRKSAAYHRARKQALLAGKGQEEAKKEGKKVAGLWITYFLLQHPVLFIDCRSPVIFDMKIDETYTDLSLEYMYPIHILLPRHMLRRSRWLWLGGENTAKWYVTWVWQLVNCINLCQLGVMVAWAIIDGSTEGLQWESTHALSDWQEKMWYSKLDDKRHIILKMSN